MTPFYRPGRRGVLRALASLPLALTAPGWAQASRSSSASRTITLTQIADLSVNQIDVSKDFLVGSRAAWQEINARGGLQGYTVRHQVIEVNGSVASLRAAMDTLKAETQCNYMGKQH